MSNKSNYISEDLLSVLQVAAKSMTRITRMDVDELVNIGWMTCGRYITSDEHLGVAFHNIKREMWKHRTVKQSFDLALLKTSLHVSYEPAINSEPVLDQVRLTDREKYVLTELFWNDQSYRSIGKKLNISHERVRQIKEAALKKCRDQLEGSRNV